MSRKPPKPTRLAYCASCGEAFTTTISTKLYDTLECAKREEYRRRATRLKCEESTHTSPPVATTPWQS